jgi:hypothetical protein
LLKDVGDGLIDNPEVSKLLDDLADVLLVASQRLRQISLRDLEVRLSVLGGLLCPVPNDQKEFALGAGSETPEDFPFPP